MRVLSGMKMLMNWLRALVASVAMCCSAWSARSLGTVHAERLCTSSRQRTARSMNVGHLVVPAFGRAEFGSQSQCALVGLRT